MKIIEFLELKKVAVSKNDNIQEIAPNKIIKVSTAIRELLKDRKIETVIFENKEDNLASRYYKIQRP
ncbi:hypothetical protein ACQKGI_20040 [Peribacillus muralis]|uniref:hypothetical protein n=1 Tax=Peribacillus muralis TaxID=264697 RepID=UPI0037FAC196